VDVFVYYMKYASFKYSYFVILGRYPLGWAIRCIFYP